MSVYSSGADARDRPNSWLVPLGNDRFTGRGQVQDKDVAPLVQPQVTPARADAAAEPAWLDVVVTPGAIADPDFPDTRPLPGNVRAKRQARRVPVMGVCALPATTKVPAPAAGAARIRLAIASSR